MAGLQSFGQGSTDPLGVALKLRARDSRNAFEQAQGPNPFMSGPLADPNWDAYGQAMQEQGIEEGLGGISPKGVGHPEGSNQFVGRSQQPGIYDLTSYGQKPGFVPGAPRVQDGPFSAPMNGLKKATKR